MKQIITTVAAKHAVAEEIHKLQTQLNTVIRNAAALGLEVRHDSYDATGIGSKVRVSQHEFTVVEEIVYGED